MCNVSVLLRISLPLFRIGHLDPPLLACGKKLLKQCIITVLYCLKHSLLEITAESMLSKCLFTKTVFPCQFYIVITSVTIADISPNANRLACDGGTMAIECGLGTSVYVLSATFGRTEVNSICKRGGSAPIQQRCSSPDALDRARARCFSKTVCTIPVNEDYLGVALTSDERRCEETSKYLSLEYECIPGTVLKQVFCHCVMRLCLFALKNK